MNLPRVPSRRVVAFSIALVGVGLVVASSADVRLPRLVYNATASVPLGFYTVKKSGDFAVGDLVVAHLPSSAERLLTERGYIAPGVPVLKIVAARDGQQVCRADDVVSVDGNAVVTARDRDGAGRDLPRWSGCRALGTGEIFLLNMNAPDSFDGRYFGPVSAPSIIGKATPLWTW